MADTQLGIVLRPTSLDEIVGQQDVVTVVRSWLDKGTVPRAIMLVGPAGTGKTTLAKIIARECQGFEYTSDPEFQPDILEINAADYNGVDDVRELVEVTNSFPMQGKYRVVILDECHMLTKPAQNVLLKPMEAANSATLWIICTTETAKIIDPLVTRCQKFELKRMSKKDVHDLLVRAAAYTGTTDFAEFEAIAIREGLNQPRPLLNAFGNFANGMPAAEAVNGQLQTFGVQSRDIVAVTMYGNWDKASTIFGKPAKSLQQLLQDQEKIFAKKKKADSAEDATEEDEEADLTNPREDSVSRPDFAREVRAILGGYLKGAIIKKGDQKAVKCIQMLVTSVPTNAFDAALEWPALCGVLFRINCTLRNVPYEK